MKSKRVLSMIEEAKESGATELDLSGKGLAVLPSELFQLTNLTKLCLGENQLSALPPEICQLINLTELELWKNHLTRLPLEICQLRKLAILNLSGNKIAPMLSEICQLTSLTKLNLSENQLTALPSELCQLTNLIMLDLWGNQLTALPQELSQLTNLTSLNVGNNQLHELSSELFQLKNLHYLNLSSHRLSSLPPELFQLTKLRELHLEKNQLTALPPDISQLSKLTELHLDKNQLAALPPELFKLINLKVLHLWSNQLATLPSEISQLSSLTTLDLSGNQFTALPLELFQLTSLTQLNLSKNQITKLPSEISQLSNLTELNLWDNQLKTLPSDLFQLFNLIKLYLGNNQLAALPPEICQLSKLELLWLYGNRLTTLPLEICQLPQLKILRLGDNQLVYPPIEIAKEGIEAIRWYFSELKEREEPLNEVKIILVGEGGAGKTSLVKRLLDIPYDQHEGTTHGINIQGWHVDTNGKHIRVNVWDFGGQEIQHATHQFFLSRRSLYVLVLDARRDDKTEYWLQYIQTFGGNSPVLVVLNKEDENPSFDVNRPFLQQKYPGIRHFFRTCCADGRGISRFREVLLKELAQVEMIGIRWPPSWFQVKQRIEQSDKPYISCEEYETICTEAGITEKQSRETLVSFLHDLGAAVHFDDYVLNAMHVLDPVWVTQAVYKIITAKEMTDSKGILRLASLTDILRQEEGKQHFWPVFTHNYILELMKKFKLCWGIGEQAVLLPQLLPVAEPKFAFDYSGALGFVLHYHDFLPPSVFPRFMVKVHQSIKPSLCWRTGVVLEDKASRTEAVIKADMEARRIYLWVKGERSKEFLSFLWFTLREINDSFEKLAVSERIPMSDDPQVTADYQTLLDNVKDGIDRYRPDGAKRAYSVKELLGLVEPEGEDEMRQMMRKIEAHLDEKETGTEVLSNLFELKPSLFGISFNLNEAFKRIAATQRQK